MKEGICPKCKSKEVIRLQNTQSRNGGRLIFNSIEVSRFLCGDCGYSEEWIDDMQNINKLKRIYTSELQRNY